MTKVRKTRVRRISGEALAALIRYDWPGNVRELENLIYRCAVVAQGDTILLNDFPPEIRDCAGTQPASTPEIMTPQLRGTAGIAAGPAPEGDMGGISKEPASSPARSTDLTTQDETHWPEIGLQEAYDILYERVRKESDKSILQAMEREMIRRALKETGGNQVKTSAILGITRSTLRKRIEQFSLKY